MQHAGGRRLHVFESDGAQYTVVAPYHCYDNVNLKTLKPIPYKLS